MNVIVAAHSLASRFCFCFEGKRNGLAQLRHRDLSKTKTKAIEPVLDADRSDRRAVTLGPSIPFALVPHEAM